MQIPVLPIALLLCVMNLLLRTSDQLSPILWNMFGFPQHAFNHRTPRRRLRRHLLETPLTDASAGICIRISAPKRQIVVCFNLPSVWRVDIWLFSLSEKSTYIFLTAVNLVFFPISWHLNLPYVEKKAIHLVLGAASDWHYMLFAKRTAIIEIIFAARVNPPPSLSLSAAVSPHFSPAFSLFCVYLAFSVPPLIPIFLLPHSIPIAFVTSSFLFLCLLVAFLFLQHFNVISLLFLLFLHSLSPSLTYTKKFPLSEVSEVRKKKCDFQNQQKSRAENIHCE